MSANRSRPHLFLLPEDDANRQIALGFQKAVDNIRQLQILPVAGGWARVRDELDVHGPELRKYTHRILVLLVDFDGRPDERLEAMTSAIPQDLMNRVFVLGTLTQPEELRRELGAFEKIGSDLARDCRDNEFATWGHQLLNHNEPQLEQLRPIARPMLFSS